MLEIFNFNYDPIRQGYDTNTWRTLVGTPDISASGRLLIDDGTGGSVIHYTDFVKGEVNLNVNIPSSPAAGDSRYFGMSSPNGAKYIKFSVGENLTCETADKGNVTSSDTLEWNTDWNGVDLDFKIVWEASRAKFYIEGVMVYEVCDDSVPYGPLSLSLFDNSNTVMTVGDMSVKGTQSIFVNPVTSDATVTVTDLDVDLNDGATVAENISETVVGP